MTGAGGNLRASAITPASERRRERGPAGEERLLQISQLRPAMHSPASSARTFRRDAGLRARSASAIADESGFTGAEKALLICFGLAIVALVGFLIGGGGRKAGGDAERTLAAGTGALGAGGGLG